LSCWQKPTISTHCFRSL